jgi:hypothetical protein
MHWGAFHIIAIICHKKALIHFPAKEYGLLVLGKPRRDTATWAPNLETMMMKKMIGLALVASLALPLAACDFWGAGKKADTTTLNENGPANESEIGNETLGNAASGTDGADNATLVDQAGPATNAVAGTTM